MKNRIKSLIISLIISFTFCSLYAADLESEKTYEVEVNGTKIERTIKSTCRNGYVYLSFYNANSSQQKEFDHLGVIVKKGSSYYTYNQNNQWEERNSFEIDLDDEQTIGVGIVPSSIIQECRIKTGMNTSTSISVHDSIQLPFANGFNGCAIFLLGIKDGCIKEVLKGKINSELLKAESKFTGSDNEITGKVYKKFISDSNLDEDILVREELATLFAYSIQNGKEKYGDQFFYNPGNIEKSCSSYLQLYLNTLYEENYPVLTSQLYSSNSIPEFGKIDSDVENNLVDAANRYLNWAVEYTIVGVETPTTNEIYKEVNGIWGKGNNKKTENYWPGTKDFPNDEENHIASGNPMPYVKGGIDTPRTFWKKMQWVYNDTNSRKFLKKTSNNLKRAVQNKKYESFDEVKYKGKFVAGTGDDLFKYAGTDDFGFLTGVLSMSGAESSFVGANKIKAAENLDEYSKELLHLIELKKGENEKKIFELEGMQNKRFEISDLEYFSIIVPDYKKIQRGDFVVKYDNNEVTLGVVVQLPENKEEEKDYRKNIKVVFIEKNTVTGKNFNSGYAKLVDFEYFYENDFTVRRLVTNNLSKRTVYNRDVLDKTFSGNTKLTVDKFTEMGSQDPNSWRFIPNTGEFLVLEGIKLVAKNNAGVNVIALYSEDPKYQYTVEDFYAKDRSYNSSTNQAGNIYNNTSDEFEIIPFNGINTIIKETDVTINDSVYKIKTNETDKSVYRSYNNSEDSSKKLVLKINPDGTFKTDSGNYAKVNIGIRPVTAAKVFPGDDLILGVKFEGIEEPLYLDEKDYVAVYDKKMLWRANLYIEKKEDELGGQDWNNAHPWNAPPAAEATVGTWADNTQNSYFAGWNANDWGYNEWNRELKVTEREGIVFTGINELPVGNGKQVTDFVPFTPIRTIGGTMQNPDGNNVIYNTVAYSFPSHSKEPPLNGSANGDSGSMDSPFDYNKKMLIQQLELNKHYHANGSKKETTDTEYNGNDYTKLSAPQNSWYHYQLSTTSKYKYGNYEAAFIPSLGLRILSDSYAQNVLVGGETGNTNDIKKAFFGSDGKGKDGVYEAGTDCVGFAQRTASYDGRNYSWYKLPKGWAEYNDGNGTDRLSEAMGKYGVDNQQRNYPSDKVEHNSNSGWPEVAVNIITKQASSDISNIDKDALLKIVPGDIFVKDSTMDADTIKRDHIAVVAYVPANAYSLTKDELIDSIILIEGEYTNCIQSVIKVITLGDYHNNNLPKGTQIYSSFSINSNDQKLNCECWAVRRLLCE